MEEGELALSYETLKLPLVTRYLRAAAIDLAREN